MQAEWLRWVDGRFAPSERPPHPAAEGKGRWLSMPIPLNCHAHLLDALIPGSPPRDVAKAVVGPSSFKHAGIARLLSEADPTSFAKRFKALHPTFPGHAVEFREGGVKGAALGRLGAGHLLMGRPGDGDVADLLPLVDGIAVSGIGDHPRGYVEECREAARRARKPFSLHASESVREDIQAILALEPDYLVHMCRAERRDMRAVADEGIPVVVCPRTSAFFGNPVPLRELLDAGVRVAVGTDNAMVSAPHPYMEAAELVRLGGPSPEDAIALVVSGADTMASVFRMPAEGRSLHWRLSEEEPPLDALSRPPDLVA